MKPIYTLNYDSFEVRTEKRQLHKSKYRRYRQIGRLLYYYCCVRYMTKEHGRWVKAMSDGVWLGDICNTNTDSKSK